MENIRIFGLTRLESLDLKKHYPDAQIAFEPPAKAKDPKHGELATAALIGLTIAGLNVLAAWLLKDRHTNVIDQTVEIVGPDGSRRKQRFKMKVSDSTSQADVIKALAPKIGFDLSQLPTGQA